MKIAQTFNLRVASGFSERCGATTRDKDCGSAEEYMLDNEILGGFYIHNALSLRRRSCADSPARVKKPKAFRARLVRGSPLPSQEGEGEESPYNCGSPQPLT